MPSRSHEAISSWINVRSGIDPCHAKPVCSSGFHPDLSYLPACRDTIFQKGIRICAPPSAKRLISNISSDPTNTRRTDVLVNRHLGGGESNERPGETACRPRGCRDLPRSEPAVRRSGREACPPCRSDSESLSFDEPLQGTNAPERRIATRKVVELLLKYGAVGVVSGHDLELANDESLADACLAAHFQETIDKTRHPISIHFDYRLRPGIATTTNALELVEVVGIQ